MQRVLGRVFCKVASRGWVANSCQKPHSNNFINFTAFRLLSSSFRTMSYTTIERGSRNSEDYRMFFVYNDGSNQSTVISPFHDIPLYPDPNQKNIVNMVVEIPRWTNHKMEINKEEELNPVKQDIKKGKVRFVKNVFPHHGYIWNYGALPQTWEDPEHEELETKTKGDQDPLDVCEIGEKVHPRGSIIQVKVLGVMCLVDEGETDWKIIVIDVQDPLADKLNSIGDVEREMPGIISATNEWFKIYKIPDGKPENKFGFNGAALGKEKAMQVIQETNEQWQKLMGRNEGFPGICCKNTKVVGSPHRIEETEAKAIVEKSKPSAEPSPLPADVDKWYYVSANSTKANM